MGFPRRVPIVAVVTIAALGAVAPTEQAGVRGTTVRGDGTVYTDCPDIGVAVNVDNDPEDELWVRRDGSIQQLQIDPAGQIRRNAKVAHANGDRHPDVRTVDQCTGDVNYFVNDADTMAGVLVRSPDANTDTARLTSTTAIAIDVPDNDYVSRFAELTITSPPRYGTVQVLSDRRIVYRPNPTHGRTDRLTYQLTEGSRRSSATVSITYPT